MQKAIYGLRQALRVWFDRFTNGMTDQWCFINSKSDSSIPYKWDIGHILLVLVYVDDIIIIGSHTPSIYKPLSDMEATFALKYLAELYYFIRVKVKQTKEGIHLSQGKYIANLLAKHDMETCSPVLTLMATSHYLTKSAGAAISNSSHYISIMGALQYVTLTKPNIAFLVNKLS